MTTKPYILHQIEPFIHIQSVAASDVTIIHAKDKPCPPVLLVLEDGVTPFEAELVYVDNNTLRVKMNLAVKFSVYIY